jgi:hypothetical protein
MDLVTARTQRTGTFRFVSSSLILPSNDQSKDRMRMLFKVLAVPRVRQVFVVGVVMLLMWAPWMTDTTAAHMVRRAFDAS